MKPLPASVLVAALLSLASALGGLIQGNLGLELASISAPTSVALIFALVHVYCAFGLLAGSNYARCLSLWLLGIGMALCWVVLWGYVRGDAVFGDYAAVVFRMAVISFFLWHLSGPNAVGYTSAGQGHDEGHGDHAHA